MAEQLASKGYFALKKQTNPTTVSVPDVYVPYYKQSLITDPHVVEDSPVYGSKFQNMQILPGQRSHGGSVTVMAEPDTAARICDMLLTKGTTTGSNPYTHPFTLSTATDPNFYTVDISLGSQVMRYIGVGASKLALGWQDDEMQFELDLNCLASFTGREIATVATTTLTLTTTYDPIPNYGLVVGDLVRISKIDGSVTLDTTIASVNVDGITVTLGASAAAFAAGDMITLRPATASYVTKTPFLWPRTQFCFGATASAALSATQTRLDKGTDLAVMHNFEDNEGSKRSGGFDPASLVRELGNYSFKIKRYFDTSDEVKYWNGLVKRAMVMRSYSETGYEFRVTFNNMRSKKPDLPTETGKVIFWEIEYAGQNDSSDGQGMDIKVINSVSTV